MKQNNRQCLKDFFQDVINRGDIEATDRYIDPSLVDHAPWPGRPATRAGFKAGLAEMRTAFPDLNVAVERMIAQDDLLVAHQKMSGTHLGDYMGTPASGKTFNIESIDIVRMKDGRIVAHWGVIDQAGMAEQLGLAP